MEDVDILDIVDGLGNVVLGSMDAHQLHHMVLRLAPRHDRVRLSASNAQLKPLITGRHNVTP